MYREQCDDLVPHYPDQPVSLRFLGHKSHYVKAMVPRNNKPNRRIASLATSYLPRFPRFPGIFGNLLGSNRTENFKLVPRMGIEPT